MSPRRPQSIAVLPCCARMNADHTAQTASPVSPARLPWPGVIGGSCFLGASWTWVIGMLFPILLVRDFGLWGWIAFAVPNVLGAMAMGLLLQSPGQALRVCAKHRYACSVFSAWTRVFHMVVLPVVVLALLGPWVLWPVLAVVVLAILWPRWRTKQPMGFGRQTFWAGLLAALTALMLVWCNNLPGAWGGVGFDTPTRLSRTDLWLFIPASVLGFVLCPWLDRTFYRTRIELPNAAGRTAFVIGFGLVFFISIVFALMYAGVLQPLFSTTQFTEVRAMVPIMWWTPLAMFLLLQGVYTTAVHSVNVGGGDGPARNRDIKTFEAKALLTFGGLSLAGIITLALGWWPAAMLGGLTPFEVGYRIFLMMYGSMFPAYVWLCMLPTWRPLTLRPKWAVALPTMVIILPMAYAAFVLSLSWWTLGVIAVLVAARGIIELLAIKTHRNTKGDKESYTSQ